MRITIVFTVMNQFPLARLAIRQALDHLSPDADVDLLIIDNGSDVPFTMQEGEQQPPSTQLFYVKTQHGALVEAQIIRHEKSIGVYPTFWDGVHTGDIVAFFHSDLVICEQDWDVRVVDAFLKHPKLGLLGFIGSNELDFGGGRGLGTTSNFQGNTYNAPDGSRSWTGSPAEVHGKRNAEYTPGAVVDGCAMLFSHAAIEHDLVQREHFPPHHFYDKLLSCEVREKGYEIGVLGIACDHISGQTVNQEQKYHDMGKEWLQKEGIYKEGVPVDQQIYERAQYLWISEYRERKHLIPYRV